MKLESLDQVLLHELKDLYSAEQQILDELPKMINKAHNRELIDAFDNHLLETQEHVRRLEQISQMIDVDLSGYLCKGMEGLLAEGAKLLETQGDPDVIDAAMISAAQRVEHYEMAGYGSAVAFAKQLGKDEIAEILQETLDEEGNANKILTRIAEGGWLSEGVNEKADTQEEGLFNAPSL